MHFLGPVVELLIHRCGIEAAAAPPWDFLAYGSADRNLKRATSETAEKLVIPGSLTAHW